jgi:hypothetical protein
MTDQASTTIARYDVPEGVLALSKRARTERSLVLLPAGAVGVTTYAGTALHSQMMAAMAVGGADMLLVGVGAGAVTSTVATGAVLLTMAKTGTFEALPALKRVLLGSAGAGAALALFGGHPLIVGGYWVASAIGVGPWMARRAAAWHALRGELKTLREQVPPALRAEEVVDTTDSVIDGEIVSDDPLNVAEYVQRWAAGVAVHHLPGTHLTTPRLHAEGRISFVVQSGPKGVTLEAANTARSKIVGTLKLALPGPDTGGQDIVFDQPTDGTLIDRSQLRAQIINLNASTAVSRRVTATLASAEDNPFRVRIGGYLDDGSDAHWDHADRDGAWSGAIVAGTGMGKSSLVDALAYGSKKLGFQIAFLDPQRGASSPVLVEHADYLGLGEEASAPMLRWLEAAADLRETWMAAHRVGKITWWTTAPCLPGGEHPNPNCPCGGVVPPGIDAYIEECDQVFAALLPGTNVRLGVPYGALAKRIRKLNMKITAVTQNPEQKTFGGSEQLRSNLPVRNLLAMHVSSNISGTLIPGLPYNPKLLPKISGRGLMCGQGSRVMEVVLDWAPRREDAEKAGDGPFVEDLFEALPPSQLYEPDRLAAVEHLPAAGADAAQVSQRAAEERLAALMAGATPVATPSAPAAASLPSPVMSWPAPVRTPSVEALAAVPSNAEELQAALDDAVDLVGRVRAAVRGVPDEQWLTAGELARRIGWVPQDADTAVLRARARELAAGLAGAGVEFVKREAGMSVRAGQLRAAWS